MKKRIHILSLIMSAGMIGMLHGMKRPNDMDNTPQTMVLGQASPCDKHHLGDSSPGAVFCVTQQQFNVVCQAVPELEAHCRYLAEENRRLSNETSNLRRQLDAYQKSQTQQEQQINLIKGQISGMQRSPQSSVIFNNNNNNNNNIDNKRISISHKTASRIDFFCKTAVSVGFFCLPWFKGWSGTTGFLFCVIAGAKCLFLKYVCLDRKIFQRLGIFALGTTFTLGAVYLMKHTQDETAVKIASGMIPFTLGVTVLTM